MQVINSSNSSQINDFQPRGLNSDGGSGLLNQLGERVHQAISRQGTEANGTGEMTINPQQVVQTIAKMSNQPVAGMNHSFVV